MLYIHYAHSPFLFFFNDTATTEIYTLSLHDALPIFTRPKSVCTFRVSASTSGDSSTSSGTSANWPIRYGSSWTRSRSEEHTSELQSPCNLVCRLLLEKKKKLTQVSQQLELLPNDRTTTD